MPSDNNLEPEPGLASQDSALGSKDDQLRNPPTRLGGIVRQLGPGMIIAGSIVGSGELIATTSTGAKAGFALLWLILIGCVIKVFVQVEFGRYAITSGKTTMESLAEVPGPRIRNHGNWVTWYWFIMFVAGIFQLGGIVGGVGQALAISIPWSEYGREFNQHAKAETQIRVLHARLKANASTGDHNSANRSESQGRLLSAQEFDIELASDLLKQELASLDSRNQLRFSTQANNNEKPLTSSEMESRLLSVKALREQLSKALQGSDQVKRELAFRVLNARQLMEREADSKPPLEDAANRDESTPGELDQTEPSTTRFDELAFREILELGKPDAPLDDKLWAVLVGLVTAVLLVVGRFGLIQSFSTVMVASFTVITIANLCMLQSQAEWSVSGADILHGLSFRLPAGENGAGLAAIAIALQTFGIIGVGANELIGYPYWCLEKGYGRYTGTNDGSQEWLSRARGWLRVMRWDAWGSMVVYTFATMAFYLLGAAVLGRVGLQPAGSEMVRYLSVMYEPVFGSVAQTLFLFGAFAVLYSTYFVANAGHARVFADGLRVLGLASPQKAAYRKRVRFWSGAFPITCVIVYCFIPKPTMLILLGGLMQAMMLPMLATAALYFRYYRIVPELKPPKTWDALLWLSALGMLIAGVWAGVATLMDVLGK